MIEDYDTDEELTKFFEVGKSFRASKSSGQVVIVENDSIVRKCVKSWASNLGRTVDMASNVKEATKKMGSKAVILVVGIDGQTRQGEDINGFLRDVNEKHPSTYVLVYTNNADRAHYLQKAMPRITTIVKGDGLANLMSGIQSNIPTRVIA